MKRSRRIAALAAALPLVGAGALATGTAQSAEGPGSRPTVERGWPVSVQDAAPALRAARADARQHGGEVLRIVERPRRFAMAGSGENPGDAIFFEGRLTNRAGTKTVGRDSIKCTVSIRTFICEGTMQIYGRGKLMVYGALFAAVGKDTVAVVGGTGEFRDVGGGLTVVGENDEDSLLIFHLVR